MQFSIEVTSVKLLKVHMNILNLKKTLLDEITFLEVRTKQYFKKNDESYKPIEGNVYL